MGIDPLVSGMDPLFLCSFESDVLKMKRARNTVSIAAKCFTVKIPANGFVSLKVKEKQLSLLPHADDEGWSVYIQKFKLLNLI